jgi:hypothetical protein
MTDEYDDVIEEIKSFLGESDEQRGMEENHRVSKGSFWRSLFSRKKSTDEEPGEKTLMFAKE